MAWRPLLERELSDRARQCVRAILEGLGPVADPSLASGNAGLALMYDYQAQVDASVPAKQAAHRTLHASISAMADRPMSASLFAGLTGVGFAISRLCASPDLDEDLEEIDAALLDHLDQSPWNDDYDLISGLVGFGAYALERVPKPTAIASLERIVERLSETAEERTDGITWWTDPRWLPQESADKYPQGYYNLGLSHGVPGVIALLAQVVDLGLAVEPSRRLLAPAVGWLLAQQCEDGFPAWIVPAEQSRAARLAWCYGDPGVAAALLIAARCANEPAWEREALTIARRACDRPPEQAGVVDAGLCHGAAGLGHVFNRLFQATGEPWLAEAARFWLVQTLEMQRTGEGVGGFVSWSLGNHGEMTWVADRGLLTGSAGIALALLAATTDNEPKWDRMLMTAMDARGKSSARPLESVVPDDVNYSLVEV